MAEHEKEESMESIRSQMLTAALNSIGSLSLRSTLERDKRSLSTTFDLLSPHTTTLTLSTSGYRIIECFLNANEHEMNVGLSESLSGDWNELEQVMKTVNGRHVCETLLDRRMKTLAHNLITKVPREWWFNNVDSLPILLKAIQLCDIDVAKKFISTEQTEADLCNTAEGLYCVLKMRMKTKDEPGWRSSLKSLVLQKAKSIKGSEAIEQVIVYGNLMTDDILEIVCRRESFDDSTTVSLIIRLIEKSSLESRRIIFDCLCTPEGNPLFYQIRCSDRFDEFKKVCDAHFTPEQRQKLEGFLVERTVSSTVDECLNAANELYGQATGEAIDIDDDADSVIHQPASRERRITIVEANEDGAYIRLENESDGDIKISQWQLKCSNECEEEMYKFHAKTFIRSNSTITVYSKDAIAKNALPPLSVLMKGKWPGGKQQKVVLTNAKEEVEDTLAAITDETSSHE